MICIVFILVFLVNVNYHQIPLTSQSVILLELVMTCELYCLDQVDPQHLFPMTIEFHRSLLQASVDHQQIPVTSQTGRLSVQVMICEF